MMEGIRTDFPGGGRIRTKMSCLVKKWKVGWLGGSGRLHVRIAFWEKSGGRFLGSGRHHEEMGG